MKTLALSLLILGTFNAMAAQLESRDGIHTSDNVNYLVSTPADLTFGEGGFLLSAESDVNAICRGFGFAMSVPNSTQYAERVEGRRTFIDSDGEARSVYVSTSFINSLMCTNESSSRMPTGLSVRNGSVRLSAEVVRHLMPVDGSDDATNQEIERPI